MKKKLLLSCLAIFISLFASVSLAKIPLQVDQAFKFSAHINQNNELIAQWKIAQDYYLYRDQFKFSLAPASEVAIGDVLLPDGIEKESPVLGKYQVFSNSIILTVPLVPLSDGNVSKLSLWVQYQGCSASGFCYPPVKKQIDVNLPKYQSIPSSQISITTTTADQPVKKIAPPPKVKQIVSEQDKVQEIIKTKSIGLVLLIFLGSGLLLAFTPCVLPMIPILSSIIVGHGDKLKKRHAFGLSLSYVLGMAVTYAAIGFIFALAGSYIQAIFQEVWVIILFSIVFFVLALSLFGVYDLQLPKFLRKRVSDLNKPLRGGHYASVFLMGVLSTILVSPCAAAPITGALIYIAHTGNVWLGASTLFVLGLGMGIPLLIIGTSAGHWLPKAGAWMDVIKQFFGVLLVAVAIWLLSRVIPGPIALALWALLCVCYGIILGAFSRAVATWQKICKGIGLCLVIYGLMLVTAATLGGSNPLKPFYLLEASLNPNVSESKELDFISVKSIEDVNKQLKIASKKNQKVMLDFFASWCQDCVTMEHYTFTDPNVMRALKNYRLLKADITKSSDNNEALKKHFQVIAPPTILFFSNEKELPNYRIVGGMNAQVFLDHLKIIK